MKKYYYADKKGQQAGPIAADQLTQNGVTETTYVWCVGMSNWDKAGNIEELKQFFAKDDAGKESEKEKPVKTENPQDSLPGNCPDNNLTWALVSILSFWPLAIVAIIKATQVKKLWEKGEQEQAIANAKSARLWALISIISGAVLGTTSNIVLIATCILLAVL